MLSQDDMHNIEQYTRHASAGEWYFSQAEGSSIEEHVALVSDLLAKRTSDELWMVTIPQDGKEPEDAPLVIAITGNGPTSEENAKFITMAHEVIPQLLSDLMQYRHLIPVLQLVYRKHVRQDESIGWEEVNEKVYTALCEAMGDLEFVEWLEHLP